MGLLAWLPFGRAHRERVKEAAEAQKAFRHALEELHTTEMDLKNATERMKQSREEFKKARREAEQAEADSHRDLTGT